MPEINIKVRDKCAEGEGVVICNNSDYTVVWDLDSEWEPYSTRTMRVNLSDGTYQDVVFTGDTAALPVLTASGWVSVGLYAGDIHTSRTARLLALSSVLTPGGSPAAPAEDVYAQIMAKLNELSTVSPEDIAKAVEDYLTEHPAASASMRVEGGHIQFSGDGETWENVIALADLKGAPGDDGITPHIGDNGNWYLGDEDTGKPSRGATGAKGPPGKDGAGMDVTGATVGQIAKIAAVDASGVPTAWEPVDMSSGGVEWEIVGEVPLNPDTTTYYIADFAIYRKIWILMDRPSNLSIPTGIVRLNFATKAEPLKKWFSAGILNNEYKYLHFDIKLEVSNLFATARIVALDGNDFGREPRSRGLKLLGNISPSELTFYIKFDDPSMIQLGDTLTILGVKR